MRDEILMNSTMIQDLWRNHCRCWEQKELAMKGGRTIAISTFTSLFSESEEKKPGRQKISCVCDWPCRWCWDLCSSGMTIPSCLTSEIHLQKFADKEEFQSWIVNFQVEVCAKAKNLALVLQWIKRPKQPARWRTPPIQNQLQEKISLKTKSWIWWWRQNWHGASIFLTWSTKLPSVEPWKDKRANIFFIEWKTEECFERKTLGSCSRRDACSFLFTRMPRETVRTTWDEVERRKEDLTLNEHPPQCRKWIHRLTWKAWTVQRPVLRWKLRILCLRLSRWKISSRNFRHHPVCRGYKSGNRCIHGYRCLYRHDGEWKPSARPRRRYSRISCYSEKKKRPRLCIRRFWSKEFYSTESWRIGIERFGGTHLKFSGCTRYKVEFLKKKVIWGPYSKKGEPRERNPCPLDFVDQPPKETSLQEVFFFF